MHAIWRHTSAFLQAVLQDKSHQPHLRLLFHREDPERTTQQVIWKIQHLHTMDGIASSYAICRSDLPWRQHHCTAARRQAKVKACWQKVRGAM